MSTRMKKYSLFTPGPVNVASNVRAAIQSQDICHREVEFDRLLRSVERKLLQVHGIDSLAEYRAVVITGSGTAANEAIMSSVVGEQRILVLSNGEFGDRLERMSRVLNKNTSVLNFGWGKHLDLAQIDAYLREHRVDIVSMVHHETSSGMLNSLEGVGAIAKARWAMLLVDCVSSTGAAPIDLAKCHISFCSGSSSKALGSYPGLSFVIGKVEAFERLKHLSPKSTYLDLYRTYRFTVDHSQTPNTPAVPLLFALEQALANILERGVAKHLEEIQYRATALRRGMSALGLKFLLAEENMCAALTAVHVPYGVDVAELQRKLREESIIIYAGKGRFKDTTFQVGNIGELSATDIRHFLQVLGNILVDSHKEIDIAPKVRVLHRRVRPQPAVALMETKTYSIGDLAAGDC